MHNTQKLFQSGITAEFSDFPTLSFTVKETCSSSCTNVIISLALIYWQAKQTAQAW